MPRTYTDEEKAAWAAKMKAAREAKLAQSAPQTLDLTKENVVNETDLLERIRRLLDEGNNPAQIKVTSRQMMDILWVSPNLERVSGEDGIVMSIYASPFGDHEVKIIPAKDLE